MAEALDIQRIPPMYHDPWADSNVTFQIFRRFICIDNGLDPFYDRRFVNGLFKGRFQGLRNVELSTFITNSARSRPVTTNMARTCRWLERRDPLYIATDNPLLNRRRLFNLSYWQLSHNNRMLFFQLFDKILKCLRNVYKDTKNFNLVLSRFVVVMANIRHSGAVYDPAKHDLKSMRTPEKRSKATALKK